MTRVPRFRPLTQALVIIGALAGGTDALAAPLRFAGAPCAQPPELHCPDSGCAAQIVTNAGSVVESKTGRTYFLDYPCDLKRGEKVTFILSLHGGGSYGNWQRHYFPILDYTDKYRLVVATPFSPRRVWTAEDDGYLQNIVTSVIEQVGHENIKAFWLAGHSQAASPPRASSAMISSRRRSTVSSAFRVVALAARRGVRRTSAFRRRGARQAQVVALHHRRSLLVRW